MREAAAMSGGFARRDLKSPVQIRGDSFHSVNIVIAKDRSLDKEVGAHPLDHMQLNMQLIEVARISGYLQEILLRSARVWAIKFYPALSFRRHSRGPMQLMHARRHNGH
jgi:hypothetical protein